MNQEFSRKQGSLPNLVGVPYSTMKPLQNNNFKSLNCKHFSYKRMKQFIAKKYSSNYHLKFHPAFLIHNYKNNVLTITKHERVQISLSFETNYYKTSYPYFY